jgi:hypothetical protein
MPVMSYLYNSRHGIGPNIYINKLIYESGEIRWYVETDTGIGLCIDNKWHNAYHLHKHTPSHFKLKLFDSRKQAYEYLESKSEK